MLKLLLLHKKNSSALLDLPLRLFFSAFFIARILCLLHCQMLLFYAAAATKFPNWKQHFMISFITYIGLSCLDRFNVSLHHEKGLRRNREGSDRYLLEKPPRNTK